MNAVISKETQHNWSRLNLGCLKDNALTSRANKQCSLKRVLPLEYIVSPTSITLINELINFVDNENGSLQDIIFSLCIALFIHHGIYLDTITLKQNVAEFLEEYSYCKIYPSLFTIPIPEIEYDFLGSFYQAVTVEGSRNQTGMYYTPLNVVRTMLTDIQVNSQTRILDPCCGSGSFLLNMDPILNPMNIVGFDTDPIAVMIAKANLITKYKKYEFKPKIYVCDFLEEYDSFAVIEKEFLEMKFDYIVTNPPWGAQRKQPPNSLFDVQETFVACLLKSLNSITPNGLVKFLLPQSFLNIKIYAKIRRYLVKNYYIKEINLYDTLFSGVTTNYIDITIKKKVATPTIIIKKGKESWFLNKDSLLKDEAAIFSCHTCMDKQLLGMFFSRDYSTLIDSSWGVGIVTGNNREKLFDTPLNNAEQIYTGKEIRPYKLLLAQKYIVYDRATLQQVASDCIYRAPEKLVYKFISRKITFAYDNSKSLFLNSANILIPRINGLSMKTIMLFLNSEIFQYIYIKKFGDVKILKGNLMRMPFPRLSEKENILFTTIVNEILLGKVYALTKAQEYVYDFFEITSTQRDYIKETLYGKIN